MPFVMRSQVVCKYKCQCCGALVKDADIYKSKNKPSDSQMSAVLTHHDLSRHNISDSDFAILTSGICKFDLEMRKSLLISK